MHEFEAQNRKKIEFFLDEKVLASIARRKQPTAYFWEDMSDLFGAWVPDKWLDACFATMAATPRHFHYVLTKRPERMREYLERTAPAGVPRVMLGTSAEDQDTANVRLPELLWTPAWQRFLSYEPALGPLTIRWAACTCADKPAAFSRTGTGHQPTCPLHGRELCTLLHRVIYGGESGAGARPNWLNWPASLIRQCQDLRVPVFIKQLGAFPTQTKIGTEYFADHPTNVIKLQLTPAPGHKRASRKGNRMEEWPIVRNAKGEAIDLRVRE